MREYRQTMGFIVPLLLLGVPQGFVSAFSLLPPHKCGPKEAEYRVTQSWSRLNVAQLRMSYEGDDSANEASKKVSIPKKKEDKYIFTELSLKEFVEKDVKAEYTDPTDEIRKAELQAREARLQHKWQTEEDQEALIEMENRVVEQEEATVALEREREATEARKRAADIDSTPPTSTPTSTTTSIKATGSVGQWVELHGNYVLRPPVDQGQPRALLHFLGGALVGAAPHLTYRYILERLAERGFLVVATPYNLSFNHLETCDAIINRFERIAPSLARQYGAVPVVGVGHSCGALLQLLITSLFPDTPRAANALLSFNNKPVKEAVPFFEEFFAPLFTAIAAKNQTNIPSGTEAMNLGLQLALAATAGELPSDELLSRVVRFGPFASLAPETIAIPLAVREALSTLVEPSASALSSAGVLPVLHSAVESLEQIPLLIEEVAGGARDFIPPPSSVRAAARRAYRARRTLILEFDDDPLDESEEIEELLVEAEKVTRMKRPMIEIDLQRIVLEGGHATPLLAPPLDLASRAEDIFGEEAAKERLLYAQADATVEVLVRWLEEGSL